jgi:hypothetical protein
LILTQNPIAQLFQQLQYPGRCMGLTWENLADLQHVYRLA